MFKSEINKDSRYAGMLIYLSRIVRQKVNRRMNERMKERRNEGMKE
jgi:hypothetical protein